MIRIDAQKKLSSATSDSYLLNVSLEIKSGERLTFYGPSGAGKTTILRMIAGLTMPDKGSITVNGTIYFDSVQKINLPTQKRNIGMVFQEHNLFPNMTVTENLRFALSKNESEDIISDVLEITELTNLKNQRPHLLSGGQKQRVALARALVRKPDLLLLDEPFSSLDSKIRRKLQQQIVEFQNKFKFTAILVSHDVAEVQNVSTRVVVIENGVVTNDCPAESFNGF